MNYNIKVGDSFSATITHWLPGTGTVKKGLWSQHVDYVVNDVVISTDGEVYVCVLAHKNQAVSNETYWAASSVMDLSSTTITGSIAADEDESSILDFTVSFVTDGSDGQYIISLTSVQTTTLTPGKYVYDIQYESGSTVTSYMQGFVYVSHQVTV